VKNLFRAIKAMTLFYTASYRERLCGERLHLIDSTNKQMRTTLARGLDFTKNSRVFETLSPFEY
jgi:hypothetical protein